MAYFQPSVRWGSCDLLPGGRTPGIPPLGHSTRGPGGEGRTWWSGVRRPAESLKAVTTCRIYAFWGTFLNPKFFFGEHSGTFRDSVPSCI